MLDQAESLRKLAQSGNPSLTKKRKDNNYYLRKRWSWKKQLCSKSRDSFAKDGEKSINLRC